MWLYDMRGNGLTLFAFFLYTAVAPPPVFADIFYSGIQNMHLVGLPQTSDALDGVPNGGVAPHVTLLVPLAGVASAWDTLRLDITAAVLGSIGANSAVSGSWVTLASTPGTFPWVHRLDYGDPYPSTLQFGGGSLLLWDYQPNIYPGSALADRSEFRDSTGYAAFEFASTDPQGHYLGPAYRGWVHLRVNDYTEARLPRLTVIDWAYSDVLGEDIFMGQGSRPPDSCVPEPSSVLLLFSSLSVTMLASRLRKRKYADA